MPLRPPSTTLTDTHFPYTALVHSLLAQNLTFRRVFRDRDELVPYEEAGCQHARDAHRGQSGEPPLQLLVLRLVRRPPHLLVAIAEHAIRSEEHTSELQSLMRISYPVFCLKKKHIQLYNTINI